MKKVNDLSAKLLDEDDVPGEELREIEEEEYAGDSSEELQEEETGSLEDPVRMYLREIGQVRLLHADEEIAIAKTMENGALAAILLAEVFQKGELTDAGNPRKTTKSQVAALLKKTGREDESAEKLPALSGKTKAQLEEIRLDGIDAKNRLAEANLRLVVSIAKRYVGRGMLFLDLIQEGNLGLMKAVDKFDYRRGFKFSTYATWWIRQAITRAIADQARTIRIPVHMVETINRLTRTQRQLLQKLGREPSVEEVAEAMGLTTEKVQEIRKYSMDPISLETPIGEEDDSHLGDFIPDENALVPVDAATFTLLREQLRSVLGTLTVREQEVLRLRFGLDDGKGRTLEEVGREFNVTRERIRQIESKALRKLRHPSRSQQLRDFLD